MLYKILLFLIINFLGLAIGARFTDPGVSSFWYQNLEKAPWTPPGWVFGAAWTTIMVCFSIYLAMIFQEIESRGFFIILFAVAWVLNVIWNPVFFYYHEVLLALLIISLLTITTAFFFFKYYTDIGLKSLLILPYIIWLFIATSLNAYILINN